MPLSKTAMSARALSNLQQMVPWVACLAFLFITIYSGYPYEVGSYDNSDFFSMYAPDAERIAKGNFPENTFNGPGYPLLLAAVSALTHDYFIAGKWIAAFAGALSGLTAFFLFRNLFGYRAAVFALLILLVSGEFVRYSIDPGTDLVFLFLCLGSLFVFVHPQIGFWQKAIITGIIGGSAYLTRYNGVFLPATFVTAIVLLNSLDLNIKRRLQLSAVHALSFLATISPWLWLNYKHHGSPLYNTNYLNMATEFYGYKPDWDGVTLAAASFHNFGDVILHSPKAFLLHYLSNIATIFGKSLSGEFIVLPLGLLAVAAIPLAILKGQRKEVSLLLLSMLLYFLVMCFNHWEGRYYFFVMSCYIGLASYLIVSVSDVLVRKMRLPLRLIHAGVVCIGITFFYISALHSAKDVSRLISTQPRELLDASNYLRSTAAPGSRVMARKPHLSYLSGATQVFFPPVKSFEELRHILHKTPADYLLYDRIALALRPELKVLSKPTNAVPWLTPVYSDPTGLLVIYQVRLDTPLDGA